jgi:hypothetical protein
MLMTCFQFEANSFLENTVDESPFFVSFPFLRKAVPIELQLSFSSNQIPIYTKPTLFLILPLPPNPHQTSSLLVPRTMRPTRSRARETPCIWHLLLAHSQRRVIPFSLLVLCAVRRKPNPSLCYFLAPDIVLGGLDVARLDLRYCWGRVVI